jgi:hypothetical protein
MLMKLTHGVNFINILQAAFAYADPKIAKKDSQVANLFCAFEICMHKSNDKKLIFTKISIQSNFNFCLVLFSVFITYI